MVTLETRDYFKKEMSSLAQFYPNLTIIGGTLATSKCFKDKSKLNQVLKKYTNYQWIKEEDANHKYAASSTAMADEENKVKVLIDTNYSGVVNVVRNTCYIFSSDNILCHDKIAAYNESGLIATTVFQPAKNNNKTSLFYLKHPKEQELISIGIEICREHTHSMLARNNPTEKPLIHFLLSDGMSIHMDHVYGQYLIHLDSEFQPQIVSLQEEQESAYSLELYYSDLLDFSYQLIGPLELLYPFECKVRAILNDYITKNASIDHIEKVQFILKILDLVSFFEAVSTSGSNLEVCDKLQEAIARVRMGLQFERVDPTLHALLNQLDKIVKNEKERGLKYVDYCRKTLDHQVKLSLFDDYLQRQDLTKALQIILRTDILAYRELSSSESSRLQVHLKAMNDFEIDKNACEKKILAHIQHVSRQGRSHFERLPLCSKNPFSFHHQGVDKSIRDSRGKLPLNGASSDEIKGVVNLRKKRPVNHVTTIPKSAEDELFELCWEAKDMHRIKQLLSAPDININKKLFLEDTCLIRAARKGHKELVFLLLQNNADKSIKNFMGETAAEVASSPEITELVNSWNDVKERYALGGNRTTLP